jgi:lysophospholipase L1-like esterase
MVTNGCGGGRIPRELPATPEEGLRLELGLSLGQQTAMQNASCETIRAPAEVRLRVGDALRVSGPVDIVYKDSSGASTGVVRRTPPANVADLVALAGPLDLQVVAAPPSGVFMKCAQGPTAPTVSSIGAHASAYTGRGPKVAIIGDSLTVQTWNQLYDALVPSYAVRIGAYAGEGYNPGPLKKAINELEKRPGTGSTAPQLPETAPDQGVMVAVAEEFAKSRPDIVVLELGTNDAWNRRSTADAISAMEKMAADFRPACMIGLQLAENSKAKGWSNREARELNLAMRDWADHVIDWARLSARPGLLAPDAVHPTPAGRQVLTDAVAEAVRSCTK